MNNFPLYTTLSSKLPSKDLTVKQKNEIVKQIASFGEEQHKIIYTLIRCYYLDKDRGDFLSLPYGAHLSKLNTVEIDLLELPIPLRHILFKFITIHEKRLEEEKEHLVK